MSQKLYANDASCIQVYCHLCVMESVDSDPKLLTTCLIRLQDSTIRFNLIPGIKQMTAMFLRSRTEKAFEFNVN